MLYQKAFIKSVLAMTAVASASSAMALNATAIFNTALLTANNITVSSIGAATYDSTSGAFSIPQVAASSTLPTMADFALTDGFRVSTAFGPLSFTDFQFNNNGMLTGKLQGSGVFLNSVTFTGDLLQGTVLSNTVNGLLATNFAASQSLASYLIDTGLTPATVDTIGSLLVSMTTPGLTVTPVPEPSTYALMGLGLVGISLVARRRRQAA